MSSMEVARVARVDSYALATCVLLVAGLLAGLLDFLPDVVARTVAGVAPLDEGLLFVGVPLGLAVSVLGRATTKTPTDAVLAAFAVPALLATMWALYSAYVAGPGVYWGGLLSIAAGTLLALAVVADALLGRLVST